MLGWALTFLIVALIAAVLGFGGIAGFRQQLREHLVPPKSAKSAGLVAGLTSSEHGALGGGKY